MTFNDFCKVIIFEQSDHNLDFGHLLGSARFTLSQQYPFFYEMFERLTIIPVKNPGAGDSEEDQDSWRQKGYVSIPKITTMAVDGYGNIYINVDFSTTELTYKQFVGVICHEIMHVALHHIPRAKKIQNLDRTIHNIATDLAINYLLQKDGIHLPTAGLLPDPHTGDWVLEASKFDTKTGQDVTINVIDKTSEEIYKIIYDSLNKSPAMLLPGPGKSGEGDEADTSSSGQDTSGTFTPMDQHDYDDEFGGQAKDQGKPISEKTPEQLEQDVKNASDQTKSRGSDGGNSLRAIDDTQEPEIDWKTVLRQYITSIFRRKASGSLWDRPSRFSHAVNVYQPMKVEKPSPSIDVIAAVDVSASIDDVDLGAFMSELRSLARSFSQEIEVLYWDGVVQESAIIDKNGMGADKKVIGRGGTRISSVKDYFDEQSRRPKVIVYLTDGWVEPNPEFVDGSNNLFIITPDGSDENLKDSGQVVKLT